MWLSIPATSVTATASRIGLGYTVTTWRKSFPSWVGVGGQLKVFRGTGSTEPPPFPLNLKEV